MTQAHLDLINFDLRRDLFDSFGYSSDSSSSSSDLEGVEFEPHPRVFFSHKLEIDSKGRSVQGNTVEIWGSGVMTHPGKVRVAQTTWKILIKHGLLPDYLHSISHWENLLKLEFYVPGQRAPMVIKFKYHTSLESEYLILDEGVP